MEVKKFEINLFKEEPLYKPGEIVSGEAVLKLNCKTKIKEVKLKFEGKSAVFGICPRKEYRTENHFYSELSFDADGILNRPGGSVSSRHKSLQKGIHVYPFQIRLPKYIPSSCHYTSADVTYSIDGAVRWPHRNKWSKYKKLTVKDDCDLNMYLESVEPVIAKGRKIFKRLCCHRGQVECTITLEQGGYVPGEIINAKILINNESRINITSCQVFLCQEIYINEVHRARTITKQFPKSIYGSIEGGRNVVWSAEIPVPQLPASNTFSSLIQTKYFVVLRIRPSTFSAYTVKCPVMIGTKPLRNSNAAQAIEQRITHHISTTSLQSTVGAANLSPSQYTATATSLHDTVGAVQSSPPTYNEAVHGFGPNTTNELNKVTLVEESALAYT